MPDQWEQDQTLVYATTRDARGRVVNRWYANVQNAGQPHEADALERCAIAAKMRAAPDMLAALEAVDKLWRAHRGLDPADPLLSPELREAWGKARAAIAKARNQGPSADQE